MKAMGLCCCALGVFALLGGNAPVRAQGFPQDNQCMGCPPKWGPYSGPSAERNWGQTITVPNYNVLDSFSFWISFWQGGQTNPPISFVAYVYAWDATASRPTGSALYQSGVNTHGPGSASQHTFQTGGLQLVTGAVYALFLHAASGSGGAYWNLGFAYTGGGSIWQVDATDEVGWTSSTWSTSTSDRQFEVQFSSSHQVVPEPSTVILLATGILGIGGVGLARRRKRPAL